MPTVSLFRLYTLRVCYLILGGGLAIYIWPTVIHHSAELATSRGIQLAARFAGLGAIALLGLRYPVKMIPILLFQPTLEGRRSPRLRTPAMESTSDHPRSSHRHQLRSRGGHLPPAHPLALRLARIRQARPVIDGAEARQAQGHHRRLISTRNDSWQRGEFILR